MPRDSQKQRDPWKVALLAYDSLCTFEFGTMVELFGLPRPEFRPWYQLQVCSLEPGLMRATGGISVQAPFGPAALDRAGTIIIPGWRRPYDQVPELLQRKLMKAHAEDARILTVCSGAFLLAATGLLDGKRATTHWKFVQEFSENFPSIELDSNVLYVDEGNLLTSAGSAAGIDMGLHLIRRDCGAKTANAVARQLVLPPHRDGGQQQFIANPLPMESDQQSFSKLLTSLRQNLKKPHTVKSMAKKAHMSERTFARHFKAATGTTPQHWLARERVHLAQTLLETSDLKLEAVATRSGFGDAQLLRLHFRRSIGTTPSAYRKSFRIREKSAPQD